MQKIAIIGREKLLAYAETETVFGSIIKLGEDAVLFDSNSSVGIDTFGSVIKIAEVVDTLDNETASMVDKISQYLIDRFGSTRVNSIDFGVSIYGLSMGDKQYQRMLINTKKALKAQSIKCRFVTPKNMQLNAAQIHHNGLLKNGVEILIVQDKNNYYLARTVAVQDIDAYTKRDFGRPNRNMKVGMFPPKLAQSMINLAEPQTNTTIYDPFCGSGVVLQESALRSLPAWGSDISGEMIEATTQNIAWLEKEFNLSANTEVFEADATTISNCPPLPYSIVTEGFLGTMLSNAPSVDQLSKLETELSKLYLDFFINLSKLSSAPQSVVITLPCWQTKDGIKKLNIIDQIIKLGYTIKQFESVESLNLIYKRPDQIVGRQILVCKL